MKTIDRYVSGRVYILGKYYHDQGLAKPEKPGVFLCKLSWADR